MISKSYQWLLWGSFIFFLGALLLRQESAITQDLGRHLRLGQMIVGGGEAGKCALFSNCLTYTYPDYPFVNHHWGSEIIFFLIYKWAGFSGIIIFKAIILGLAFFVTLFHSLGFNKGPAFLKRPGLLKPAIAMALVFFSIQMMADRLTTRPEIFGYLFFSLVFFILSRSYIKCSTTFYILPLIILLWTNLHISFIFGLVLIWTWTINKYFMSLRGTYPGTDRYPAQRCDNLKTNTDCHSRQNIGIAMTPLVTAISSTIATIFNPSGLRGALMPQSILKDYGYTVVENMTPFFLSTFKPQQEYWIYAFILIATIGLFLFSPAEKNPFHLSTFFIFSLFPLFAVRHLPFFALIIPPILTELLLNVLKCPTLASAKVGHYHTNGKFRKLPIIVSGGLLFATLTNPIPLTYAKLPPIKLSADSRHDSAVEFVKQSNLQGQMWNNYDIGSFLEWAIPEHKTFVDGRPEAFPVGFFQDVYIPMQEDKATWDLVVTKYDIQWTFVALTDATPWFTKWWQMIQDHKDWRFVYIDNFSAVLVKVDSQNNLIGPQGKAKILKINNLD